MLIRCGWVPLDDPIYVDYHDREWGVPIYDDRALFEMLVLDGAQAGLSWSTILKKRDNYRAAFDGFDPEKIVRYDDAKVAELLNNPGIVRNRLKINAAIKNAKGFIALTEDYGSFSDALWQFVDGKPKQNAWETLSQIPAKTPESEAMSKFLVKRGFTFVGPTISFMQAAGMVNDHTVDCFRYGQLA
ncbi:MAG: DNA-3-methyladenine glycosylase I [Armatimonadota bacterium]